MEWRGAQIPDWVMDELAMQVKRKATGEFCVHLSDGGVRSVALPRQLLKPPRDVLSTD